MRILHCIWSMGGGGAERQLVELAGALVSRGWDVHVVVVFPGIHDAALDATGCRVHRISSRGSSFPVLMKRLYGVIRAVRPQWIQTWLGPTDVLAGPLALILRVPWILSERSHSNAYPPTLLHRVRAFLGRHADLIVANSTGGREYWISRGVPIDRIELIPNAVPLARIDAQPAADRTSLPWKADEPLIVWAGRFSEEKNVLLMVEALGIVMRRTPVSAILFGDGPLREAVVSRLRELGISDRVRLAGFANATDLWSWLKVADVQVSTSTFEGQPNVVLEGMACGVPLVISDIPSHRAILDDSTARFSGADPSSFAAAIEQTLADGRKANERAVRARERVAAQAMNHIVPSYEAIYLGLPGKSGAGEGVNSSVRNLRDRQI